MNKRIISILLIILFLLLICIKVDANAAVSYPHYVTIKIKNKPQIDSSLDMIVDCKFYVLGIYNSSMKENINEEGFESKCKTLFYGQLYNTADRITIDNLLDIDNIVVKIDEQYSNIQDIKSTGKTKNLYFIFDYNTKELKSYNYSKEFLYNAILCMLFTVVIEIVVAKIMKFNHLGEIAGVNIITQILLHLLTYLIIIKNVLFSSYLFFLIIMEIIIIFIEAILYKILLKKINKKEIIEYCIIANIFSFLASYGISVLFK